LSWLEHGALGQTYGVLLPATSFSGQQGSTQSTSFNVPAGTAALLFIGRLNNGRVEAALTAGHPIEHSQFPPTTMNFANLALVPYYNPEPPGAWFLTMYGVTNYTNAVVQVNGYAASDPILYSDNGNNILLNVPPLLQNSDPWGNDVYDHHPDGKSMASKGCAVTSLAMAINNTAATHQLSSMYSPGELNTFMKLNKGFSEKADVKWDIVPAATNGQMKLVMPTPYIHSKTNPSAAASYLTQALGTDGSPVIVHVKPMPNNPKSHHFVLVVGKDGSRFRLNDPGSGPFVGRHYLDEYSSGYEIRGKVVVTGKKLSSLTASNSNSQQADPSDLVEFEICVGNNVDLQVVDSAGKVTGLDFGNSAELADIPNSTTFTDGADDAITGDPDSLATHFVYLKEPIGDYQIRVIGRQAGPYRIDIFRSVPNAEGVSTSFSGTTAIGKIDTFPLKTSGNLLNISTRLRVGAGDNAMIAGFIITGSESKKVIIRGMGPSLAQLGVPATLSDPRLDLFRNSSLIASNDNWQEAPNADEIPNGFAPGDSRESVIVTTLVPGNYTAILRGAEGETGVGIIETYDLSAGTNSKLANISTRGLVDVGDNGMIGGLIVAGGNGKVLVRAMGPSLQNTGVTNALQDPTLELIDANGATITFNDDWQQAPNTSEIPNGFVPSDTRESVIVSTVGPGNHTAIVRGYNDTTGVALVEVYNLQ
jgi:Peptidase_C39 like family